MKIDKNELLDICIRKIDEKLEMIQQSLNDYQKDLDSETKSSVGDKHETGRAMLQLEMEKLGQQYQVVLNQKNILKKINTATKNRIQLGSLAVVNSLFYFLATSIGQVVCQQQTVMVISINSPIGKLLIEKKEGDSLVFNGKELKVEAVL